MGIRNMILCALTMILIGIPVASAPKGPRVPRPLVGVNTIVTLGDSITQGGGAPGGYVWLMQKYLVALYPQAEIKIVNSGISGHKSTDMYDRFERDVVDHHPQIVTISVGVNDVWHGFRDFANDKDIPAGNGPNGVPLSTYRDRVKKMVRMAQRAHIKVYILTATVIHEDLKNRENARLAQYNRTLREIAGEERCTFVDLNEIFRKTIAAYQKTAGKGENLLTTDGVHMNPAGNRLMASTILHAFGISDKQLKSVDSF